MLHEKAIQRQGAIRILCIDASRSLFQRRFDASNAPETTQLGKVSVKRLWQPWAWRRMALLMLGKRCPPEWVFIIRHARLIDTSRP